MDKMHLAAPEGEAYPIPLQTLNQQSLNQQTLNQNQSQDQSQNQSIPASVAANNLHYNTTFHPQNPFQPQVHSHSHPQHANDDANSFVSYVRHHHHHRPASVLHDGMPAPAERRPRKLVLCFDGTGNKFRGDDSDSNILKIFRMLDRTADDQYHYYQPGIGTYVVSGGLSNTSTKARIRSWYMKAKDSAFGSSFDQHVVGGYRFLMRFYNPGDEIYVFGFSRGAYIARFLAEMLDYVGLLSHGNEEMVHFAWKSFSQWQCRRNESNKDGGDKKKEMYTFMKGFRETFSRPVRRIQFLGLFDTVNSVPRFETAWMERSKFPYTARSSAKVIRHAVSIDERRAKFRQDLVYQSHGNSSKKHRDPRQVLHDVHEKYRARHHSLQAAISSAMHREPNGRHSQDQGRDDDDNNTNTKEKRGRKASRLSDVTESGTGDDGSDENFAPYRAHSRSRSRESQLRGDDMSVCSHGSISSHNIHDDDDDAPQDLSEVWFSGDHADIGGGWEITPGVKSASHVPLTWMVREAMRAGLTFDAEKVLAMGCSDVLENQWAPNLKEEMPAPPSMLSPSAALNNNINNNSEDIAPEEIQPMPPNIRINSQEETLVTGGGSQATTAGSSDDSGKAKETAVSETPIDIRLSTPRSKFHDMMHKAHTAPIHDSLEYGKGLHFMTVNSWKVMEYMPFRRMDLQSDGSWKPIRWPLPCGETRDVPDNVYVHGSVLRRMRQDPSYRPGNLIVGGGGRGCRVAPAHYGMGEWECVAEEGDPIGELWMKKAPAEE
ncbi:hypothetical protein SBRCBS47491_000661 [Sporothrix bragantina]|uniref:T6SS Phospholipase effector Tle1-like catalytic domain-containing protein n=1 Tax=Sporothrix bragantina TaxID=671064 RepID=A0ABP0AS84_9PEZI